MVTFENSSCVVDCNTVATSFISESLKDYILYAKEIIKQLDERFIKSLINRNGSEKPVELQEVMLLDFKNIDVELNLVQDQLKCLGLNSDKDPIQASPACEDMNM